jgi:hypothetical protein
MDRRAFSKELLTSVTSFALIDTLLSSNAVASAAKPITNHWAMRLNAYCADLRKQSLTVTEWQTNVETLFDEIPLKDLLKFIDFTNLSKGFEFPDLGVNTRPVKFPKLEGLPEKTVFLKKLFGMKKDRAIIPHGHVNMASAHLIIKGEMHLRHYEKIRQEEQTLLIKPSIDKIAKVGENSSISDEKDNVHWFIANTDTAFTFDVIMLDLKAKPYDIYNLDMYKKQKLSNGTLRVPILDVETALKKYGNDSHH